MCGVSPCSAFDFPAFAANVSFCVVSAAIFRVLDSLLVAIDFGFSHEFLRQDLLPINDSSKGYGIGNNRGDEIESNYMDEKASIGGMPLPMLAMNSGIPMSGT